MPQLDAYVTEAEFRAGVDPALEDFRAIRSPYDVISQSSRELFEEGRVEAIFVPMVKYAVDATLNVVEQPSVEERLPREVAERGAVGLIAAQRVIREAIADYSIVKFFLTNQHFRWLHVKTGGGIAVENFMTPGYLSDLGTAAFGDASWVAGGAFKLLQREEERGEIAMDEEPAEIILRSTGLLAISRINEEKNEEIQQYLGWPYVGEEHLVVSEGERGLQVSFARETLETLHDEFAGRGCPANEINDPEGQYRTLLRRDWRRIVSFLLPPDATATR